MGFHKLLAEIVLNIHETQIAYEWFCDGGSEVATLAEAILPWCHGCATMAVPTMVWCP